ncbi:hypothetical protein EVAR_66674_1 [Eumeta japonica]|uniref:Histone-lysine N-methyltransferase SETMAR n=1 Tax=Eumeta variegata TaxID=151549 RepID=A0A4C1ZDW9_EUMVA|nr:hypothetical protein EVAR_66674_1 [Eumeta japonica]
MQDEYLQLFAEFKCDRVNLSDEFCDGHPFTAVNNKNIDAVRRMLETDRHETYHETRAFLGISLRIQSMLHKHLGMKKLCSRWIPHSFTEAQNQPHHLYNAMFTKFRKERQIGVVHSNRWQNVDLLLRPQNKEAINSMSLLN